MITETIQTRYLKLPFSFKEERLVNDLSKVLKNPWKEHFNTQGYNGEWKVVALYAHGGDKDNIFALTPENRPFVTTEAMEGCEYFREVVETFRCKLLTVRLLNLAPGSEILPHNDVGVGYQDNVFRIHVPITTNEGVEFLLENERIIMQPGECWYTNVSLEHSVKNTGSTDRVHLVIDCERNDWSDELFFSLAPEESFKVIREEHYTHDTILRMIEELEQQDNPGAEDLIRQLKSDLNTGA